MAVVFAFELTAYSQKTDESSDDVLGSVKSLSKEAVLDWIEFDPATSTLPQIKIAKV